MSKQEDTDVALPDIRRGVLQDYKTNSIYKIADRKHRRDSSLSKLVFLAGLITS